MLRNKKLKLSIKPQEKSPNKSADYEIKLNDYEIGHGVTSINLYMNANSKPELRLIAQLDDIDVEGIDVETFLKNVTKQGEENE